jgi:CheY-like chemotaxis protein
MMIAPSKLTETSGFVQREGVNHKYNWESITPKYRSITWFDPGRDLCGDRYQSTIDIQLLLAHSRLLFADEKTSCESELMVTRPLITVVDDDESVRESLPDLLKEFGFEAEAFSSAEDFLASESIWLTRCLVLDMAMPGMTGPDLQRELTRRDQSIPIVFITGQWDEAVRPSLLAQGAVDCLFKPFDATDLLQALNAALRAG